MIHYNQLRRIPRHGYLLFALLVILLLQGGNTQQEGGRPGGFDVPINERNDDSNARTSSDETTWELEKDSQKAGATAKLYQSEDGESEPASFNARDHFDWGSYYDPQNIFCGQYDCYRILGFDYESFGSNIPDSKLITKRYRNLSREWHPDKSRHINAKERFVKIARAYEVLTNEQQRLEYDFMRYNQEAYFQKYGANVLWQYAPKSDASIIILILVILANCFTWVAQKSRWQNVANRLTQAAVEDWSPSQGGTAESKQLREKALGLLAERQLQDVDRNRASPNNGLSTTTKGGKKAKISGKDKKKLEQENLKPIIRELVTEIRDFGAGFHQPTWKDLFVVKLASFPYHLTSTVWWHCKYCVRRLQKKDLNDKERQVLTERAVGNVTWELASTELRSELVRRELWLLDNLVEWKEEQEVKTWSKSDQKFYHKMKKRESKGGKDL